MTLTPNEIIFEQITEKQLQLLRYDAHLRSVILKKLKDLEKTLVLRLTEEDTFNQRRLRALLADVKDSIKQAYGVINNEFINELTDLGQLEASNMVKIFNSSLISVELSTVPIEKIVRVIQGSLINGSPAESWWQRQAVNLQQNFEDTIRTSIMLGDTNTKIIQKVRGTKAFNYTDGIMQTSRREAEALVRTGVQMSANQARFAVMDANLSFIDSYQHVSTLDNRTTITCIVRDGKLWDAKTKKPLNSNLPFQIPPIHWKCRSTLIAKIKGVKLPNDAIRASKDGPVKANTTFEDFLKKKGKDFEDEVLGKGRAELWRKGKITLTELLDQSGNALSLKQLKDKYGV